MCHFLYVASPLTLSEVRSMLPRHVTADALAPDRARQFLTVLPEGQTAARILIGACSCDFFLARDPRHHREESELRRRYRDLGLSRDQVIRCLERHRKGEHPQHAPELWMRRLAAFVAEHARNAGESVFYREFSAGPLRGPADDAVPALRTAAAVRDGAPTWLPEGIVTRVATA